MVKFIVFVIITFVSQVHDQTYYVPLSCTFIFRLFALLFFVCARHKHVLREEVLRDDVPYLGITLHFWIRLRLLADMEGERSYTERGCWT